MKKFKDMYLCCYSSSCKTSSLYTRYSCHNCKYAEILNNNNKKLRWGGILFLPCHNNEKKPSRIPKSEGYLTPSEKKLQNQTQKILPSTPILLCQDGSPEHFTSQLYCGLIGFVGLLPSKWFLLCLPIKNPWPVPLWLAKSMGVSDLFWSVSVCKKERRTISQCGMLIYWNGLITVFTI